MSKENKKCFIIMPITTPKELHARYGSADHFKNVLEHLFIPAVEKAGFEPIPPKAKGSDVIQAEIIKHLSESPIVLCDMSILNPNVFFEFGIRTALDKPVSLIADDKTEKIPFDTSIIHFHIYNSSPVWNLDKEIENLSNHIQATSQNSGNRNALWKYFGVAQKGAFKPEEVTVGEKVDLLLKEVSLLKEQKQDQRNELDMLGEKIIRQQLFSEMFDARLSS